MRNSESRNNYRISNNSKEERKNPRAQNRKINKEKLINLKLFKFKHMFLKISVDLKTALAAEIHPA